MASTTQEIGVNINHAGTIDVTLHIRGLRSWRLRMAVVCVLLKWINWIAPKNVHVGVCGECSEEI